MYYVENVLEYVKSVAYGDTLMMDELSKNGVWYKYIPYVHHITDVTITPIRKPIRLYDQVNCFIQVSMVSTV